MDQVKIEKRQGITVTARNGLAHLVAGKMSSSLPFPVYQHHKSEPDPLTNYDILHEVPATHDMEDTQRFPAWALQDAFCKSVGASLILGIPPLARSPNIKQSWADLSPETWTDKQEETVWSAKSGVLFLHGKKEDQEEALDKISDCVEDGATWLIVHQSGMPSDPRQVRLAACLSGWAWPVDRLPSKMKLWQPKGSWATSTHPSSVSDKGLRVWLAGHKYQGFPEEIPSWTPLKDTKADLLDSYREGSRYTGLPGVLAATDGSLSKSLHTMGAGVAYCPLGDSFIGMVDKCV